VKILLTNFRLAERTASEVSVRDLAFALRRLGHDVCVFASKTGPLADEFADLDIPVIAHPGAAPFKPDLIHGQYNLETIAALLSFPDRPALYLSFGTRQWREHPPIHPRILRYLSFSQSGREWLHEAGVPRAVTRLLPGAVEMDRFVNVRRLPEAPARALIYDRTSGQGRTLEDIRQACQRCHIQLDLVGDLVGKSPTRPEIMLPEYDLVFASGRSAIEALASGCAVIPVRDGRCGKLVTTANFDSMRDENFSPSESGAKLGLGVETLVNELENWDWRHLAPVARRVREEMNSATVAAQLVKLYEEVLADDAERRNNARSEFPALTDWLIQLADQHHLVDSGFLAIQHRVSSLKSVREENESRTEELTNLLEMEKAKVRAARRLFKEGNIIHQGLWKRIENEWRELERQHLEGGSQDDRPPPFPGGRAPLDASSVRDFTPARELGTGVELPG
jgi:hypothetical protein